MIRICFITTLSCTLDAFVLDFAEYLHRTGRYDISFLCNEDEAFCQKLPKYIHFFPVSMKRGISLGAPKAIRAIRNILRRERFDIVQYSTPNAAFYASIAAKAEKVPVRLYCQWGIRYMGFDGFMRFAFKQIEKVTCRNSTVIEPESFRIYDFAVQEKLYPAEKGTVVWNGSACGVNTQIYDISQKSIWRNEIRTKFSFAPTDVVFGFAARLTRDKGINELLKGFRIAEIPNAKLLIMGSMDDEASIDSEFLEWAKQQQSVIFAGNVPDIYRYYAALDVFLSPSYREGFGLVLIEAQAMGVPVIATDVPGQIDAFLPEESGIAVPVKDAQAIASAMCRLADESALCEAMSKSARAYAVKNFDQQVLFTHLEEKRSRLAVENTSCRK